MRMEKREHSRKLPTGMNHSGHEKREEEDRRDKALEGAQSVFMMVLSASMRPIKLSPCHAPRVSMRKGRMPLPLIKTSVALSFVPIDYKLTINILPQVAERRKMRRRRRGRRKRRRRKRGEDAPPRRSWCPWKGWP